jgi:hypothetical protein
MKEVRAALWGVCAFGITYVLAGALRLPALAYDPVARTVGFTSQLGGLSMRYYGDLLWACAAFVIAAASTLRMGLTPRSVARLSGAALSIVALAVAWYLSPLVAPV